MKKLLTLILTMIATISLHAESEIVAFHLNSETGLPDNNIQRIWQDSLGYIIFSGRYSTFRYDGYGCQPLSDEESARLNPPTQSRGDIPGTVFGDNLGNKVRLLANGNLEYSDSRNGGKNYTFPVVSPHLFQLTQRIKCTVITDCRGLIWVSTNGSGLRVYNPASGELQVITRDQPNQLINTDHIISMMEDRDGNIWVSGEYHGVTCLKVKPREYQVIDINTSGEEKGSEVRMLQRLSNGHILMADMAGKVSVSDDDLQTIKPLATDGRNYISACIDDQDNLWLGSRENGIYLNGQHYSSGRVDCIVKDQKGRMWTCGLRNVVKQVTINDGTYQERQFLEDSEDLDPRVMLVDHRGDIWLGTKKGLYVFNPDSLLADPRCYHHVMEGRVMCLYESSEQYIWVGTSGTGAFYGAGREHRASSFIQVTSRDGLANDIVQLIGETPEQHLCIGTEDGLSFIDPFKRQIRNLFFTDSRLRNIFSERNVVRLADGRMAFGTYDGIVVTDTLNQQSASRHPLLITGMEINGTPVSDMGDECPFEGDISTIHELSLSHVQNSLTFYFSNLDYGNSRQTTYLCQLEGYDQDWISLRTQNQTTYKNLSTGTYTLRVRSTEVAGQQEGGEAVLIIHILPPWWRTWWAYLIYLVITAAIIFAIYRQVRHISQLHRRIAIEKELTDYKLKFFTNISHEFRTPLTLIQGSMDKLKSLSEAPSSVRAPLSNMQRNVDRMLRLINQLLEFRRMQNNKLSLSLEETDIVAFVYNICQGFHDTAEQKRIALSFVPAMKSHTLFTDRGFIDKSVYNLLSNAFKYTPSGGSVTVRLKNEDERLKIIVEDTGIGVPEDMREKIFDRFQRGQTGRDSLGIGLDLTAELIRTHHGTIRCEENPGGGSIFTIELPVDKSVYDEKDFLHTDTRHQEEKTNERQGFTELVREAMPEPMNDHRILIVEDDAEIAAFLKQELGRYFQIETAGDGEEALEKIENGKLIITDAMMPRMNGFELIRQLRKNEETRHLPIIMLTALNAEDQQMKGLEVGADAYITKPFSMPLLIMQVRNLLQRSADIQKATTRQQAAESPIDEDTKSKKALAAAQVIVEERDKRLLAQLSVWVDSHLASPELSVDKFAEDMGYGRTNFYAKLKALTGQTPNEYIKERRLQRAYELLADERVTVAEAAYQVGMATPQYLSTTFKKRFGITPTEYQKGKKA